MRKILTNFLLFCAVAFALHTAPAVASPPQDMDEYIEYKQSKAVMLNKQAQAHIQNLRASKKPVIDSGMSKTNPAALLEPAAGTVGPDTGKKPPAAGSKPPQPAATPTPQPKILKP